MITNSCSIVGRCVRVDVREALSKGGKPYVSCNLTLRIGEDDNSDELVVRLFSMKYKNNGDELASYKGIATLMTEAKALHKTYKDGDNDAVEIKDDTIVEDITECEIIKCSSYKDFKFCRLETSIVTGMDGVEKKYLQINANYVNRGKEGEEFNPVNKATLVGKIVKAPVEMEDADENPIMKFTIQVPVFSKGYTKATGEVVEDKVDLHEFELVTYDTDMFGVIEDEFQKGNIAYIEAQMVRRIKRVEVEASTEGRRIIGAVEKKKEYKTEVKELILFLGGYSYDEGELDDTPEFNEELWEKAMNKESKQEVQQEQPKRDDRMKGGSGAKLPF